MSEKIDMGSVNQQWVGRQIQSQVHGWGVVLEVDDQECLVIFEEKGGYKLRSMERTSCLSLGEVVSSSKFNELVRAYTLKGAKLHAHSFLEAPSPRRYYPASGKVIGEAEVELMTHAVLDGWLTAGRFTQKFEEQLAMEVRASWALTVNSGSSANLLALTALTSPKLGARRLKAGDEVITAAAGFPTTINPILQNQLIPVLVDSQLETGNMTRNKCVKR